MGNICSLVLTFFWALEVAGIENPSCTSLIICGTIDQYTLSNPDTLTKYKTAAQISHKVLEAVSGMAYLPVQELSNSAYTFGRLVC